MSVSPEAFEQLRQEMHRKLDHELAEAWSRLSSKEAKAGILRHMSEPELPPEQKQAIWAHVYAEAFSARFLETASDLKEELGTANFIPKDSAERLAVDARAVARRAADLAVGGGWR